MTKLPSVVWVTVFDQLVPAGAATGAIGSADVVLVASLSPQAETVIDRAIRASPVMAFTACRLRCSGVRIKGLVYCAAAGNASRKLVQLDPPTSLPLMVKAGVPPIFTLFHASSVIANICFIAAGLAMQASS